MLKSSKSLNNPEDVKFFKDNAPMFTKTEWSDIFGISVEFIKRKAFEWGLSMKVNPREKYTFRNPGIVMKRQKKYVNDMNCQEDEHHVPISRPPAEYSNKSPMGIASAHR